MRARAHRSYQIGTREKYEGQSLRVEHRRQLASVVPNVASIIGTKLKVVRALELSQGRRREISTATEQLGQVLRKRIEAVLRQLARCRSGISGLVLGQCLECLLRNDLVISALDLGSLSIDTARQSTAPMQSINVYWGTVPRWGTAQHTR